MITQRKYKVVGVSTHIGKTKVRFSNDYKTRIKTIERYGHTDVTLVELEDALDKITAANKMLTMDEFKSELNQSTIKEFIEVNA